MSQEEQLLPEESGGLTPLYRDIENRLQSFGERCWATLVYTSAYLAVIAAAEVVIVMTLLSLPWSVAPLVVGLITLAVYVADRIADAEVDAVSVPKRAAFVRRHADTLYVVAAVAYGLAVALSTLAGPLALGLALLPGLFWVVYASDWVPAFGAGASRLKDVFLVNSGVVALAWATTLTFMPLAFAGADFTPATAVAFVYFFLRTFTNTEIPNVRDVASDRALGVRTLPVVLGVRRTRQALYAVDGVTVGLLAAAALAGYVPDVVAAALVVGTGYSLLVTTLVGRTGDLRRLVVAAESEFLFALAVVVVLTAIVP